MRGRVFLVSRSRRGVAAVMFGLLLPVILGMVALSVDVAVVALARDQLSTAADAAALAGAMQLADEYRVRGVTDLVNEIGSANAQAQAVGQSNRVLNQNAVIVQNTANLVGTGDIQVGFFDANNPGLGLQTGTTIESRYNSVQVTARRDASHTGLVPTFFSQILGFRGTEVVVPSMATAQNYSISGFKTRTASPNVHLLPIVLDTVTYQQMIQRNTQDHYGYDPATNTVNETPDGITESVLYPVGSGSPGNWGTIKVGVSNNSTSTLNSQIMYGITPEQMATFPNSTIQLDYTQSPPSIIFEGNPGISAGISSALQSIIGDPVIIPIYDTNGGNGDNAWYRVIQFAGVRILSVNFQGNPKYVIVQPALVNEPDAIAGTQMSSWTSGGLIVLHLTR